MNSHGRTRATWKSEEGQAPPRGPFTQESQPNLQPVALIETALVGRAEHDLHDGEGGDGLHIGREDVPAAVCPFLILVPASQGSGPGGRRGLTKKALHEVLQADPEGLSLSLIHI